tara:strand:- start:941 stop:1393 length:453 start_codon:yes stop_codon:yes gene_type:complete
MISESEEAYQYTKCSDTTEIHKCLNHEKVKEEGFAEFGQCVFDDSTKECYNAPPVKHFTKYPSKCEDVNGKIRCLNPKERKLPGFAEHNKCIFDREMNVCVPYPYPTECEKTQGVDKCLNYELKKEAGYAEHGNCSFNGSCFTPVYSPSP